MNDKVKRALYAATLPFSTFMSSFVTSATRRSRSEPGCRLNGPSPMAHQTGFGYGFMLPMMLGARMVLMDSWHKDLAARLIAEERVTFTMASTPFLMDLSNAVEADGFDSSSLRIFLCAGTVIPGPLVERAHAVLGTKVVSAWGMTENGAVTLVSPSDPDERSVDSDGFVLPGVDLQIRISGRSKDIVIRGAENIPVVEVEGLLYKHPAVAMVAIVGYPDERLGERACAFVVPKPGQTFNLEDMVAFLESQHLARQYFPERLEIRDQLPSTASGKIQKFALRNELKGEYEARKK